MQRTNKMFSQSVNLVPAYYSPDAYAECSAVLRTPLGISGLSMPKWTESYRDSSIATAIALNPLNGLAGERMQNAPSRDEQFFPIIVAQRPIIEYPHPTSLEADSVPKVFSTQVQGSDGFDIGNDQVWVNDDYAMFCAAKQ